MNKDLKSFNICSPLKSMAQSVFWFKNENVLINWTSKLSSA